MLALHPKMKSSMDNFKALLVLGVASAFLYGITGIVYRLYFHPLSSFPGSKIAAATRWYEFYWDVVKRGQYIWRIEDMHRKYGPIIRVSPDELHIDDPDYYDELYAPGSKKRDKWPQWVKLAGAPNSSFSTVSHDVHRMRRGALNPFFSKRTVSQLQPLIQSKVEKLATRLKNACLTGEVIRLDAAFMALTMDVICDYAFANDQKYLDEHDFKLEWKETIIGAFEGGALLRQFPWLLKATKSMPISFIEKGNPHMAFLLKWQDLVREQVSAIVAEKPNENKIPRKTIFHTLRDSDLPAQERTLDRLCDEGEILTGAGSETTAKCLTHLAFYVLLNPIILQNLRAELIEAIPDLTMTVPLSTLEQLPYLTAVISEGLRLSYSVTTRLPRVANDETLKYGEWVIPPGTPVSETPYFVLMNPKAFPDPKTFRPERWLESGTGGSRLDRYLVSFGRGSRQCLGMNLAYAELYLTVSTLYRRFEFELFDTSLKDVQIKHDFFVAAPDLESKGVRARVKKVLEE